jgi:hypothetical protein
MVHDGARDLAARPKAAAYLLDWPPRRLQYPPGAW